jgi:hypothetical protein
MRDGTSLALAIDVNDVIHPLMGIHLSEFALDKLWRLFFETAGSAMPLISDSGITSEDSLTGERL